MKKRNISGNALLLSTLVPSIIFVLFPIYWAINTAFKTEGSIVTSPVTYFPHPATIQNFLLAWHDVGFSTYFFNSMLISVTAVLVVEILAIMAGYALSRYKFKGKNIFMIVLLATQFIPAAVLLIPLFNIFNTMGLIGTRTSIILANITFQLPFNSVLMRGFISNIPFELEESARVDGCTKIKGFLYVILPILRPGIVTIGAFAFIGCWNEFLFSLMFLNDPKKFTIPIGLQYMQGQFNINYGALAAGALIAISVPAVLFSYLQKYLVQGLTSGAIKG
ncbi:carbohydrate ABC transporter permease [uncultured Sphaerochaeta sp.]|uniref:carbohydrate ABC transporter permease n=1 Tax=uncultured Sphaerochaeta sp. TaxID=886478 RepID=UPI002A0A401B|nr:carbohydrate ABC transporter permease [uncultured Sphaerochaeta sp.]